MCALLATFGTLPPLGSPASKHRLSARLRKTPYHQRKGDAAAGKRQVSLDVAFGARWQSRFVAE